MSYNNGWTTQPAQAGPSQPRTAFLSPNTPFTPHAPTPLMSHTQPDMAHGMMDELQPDAEPSPSPPVPGLGQLVEPHQGLNEFLESFWTRQMEFVEKDNPDFRTYPLPLARIKKVMKSDEEVKMISAEAPILFSKACELFISELTCRAWLIAESKKRRTLQKSDVAAAIALSDMFDFLIDILPRDDDGGGEVDGSGANGGGGHVDTGVEGDEGGVDGEDGDEDGEEGENGQYGQEG